MKTHRRCLKNTVFDENTLMLHPWRLAHSEFKVLEACRLSRGPVNAKYSRTDGNIGHIDYDVSDLPIEDVGRFPCQCSSGLVRVGVDDRNSREIRRCLDHREIVRIPNDLCKVKIDDGA